MVPVVVSRLDARSLVPVYDARKIVPPTSSAIILEPDPHNLIAGELRTIWLHCFRLNPTSGTKIHHRINIICASGHQRLHLGVEPSFEVNNAGGGYLIISWLLVSSKGELSILCLGTKQIYLLGPRLLLTSSNVKIIMQINT
jgi:hypothetical protein